MSNRETSTAIGASAMLEEDIRPAESMLGHPEAMASDIAWLNARKDQFRPVSCPACGTDDFRPLYVKDGMSHVGCKVCGAQYVTPRPTEEVLAGFYAQSRVYAHFARHVFPASHQVRQERIFGPRARRLAAMTRGRGLTGTFLEVGAAHGMFCDAVRRLAQFARIVGIEPTPELAGICRDKGFEVLESVYEQVELDEQVDVIANFEVIEHLHDPGKFLAWCFGQLRSGGGMFLSCPNIRGFETLALGARSKTIDHEHINLFNPTSLQRLAERIGFTEVTVITPGELDMDIVGRALRDGTVTADDLGPVVTTLLESPTQVRSAFQNFLKANQLSSHMMMMAFRP